MSRETPNKSSEEASLQGPVGIGAGAEVGSTEMFGRCSTGGDVGTAGTIGAGAGGIGAGPVMGALIFMSPMPNESLGLGALGAAFFFGAAVFLGTAFFRAAFLGTAFFGAAFLGAFFFGTVALTDLAFFAFFLLATVLANFLFEPVFAIFFFATVVARFFFLAIWHLLALTVVLGVVQ